jgi:hypothetical protein
MERGVWGERLKKSFHFKYKSILYCFGFIICWTTKVKLYFLFQKIKQKM